MKMVNYDLKDYPAETRIPTMYFQPVPDFINTKVFLPPELQYQPNKKPNITFNQAVLSAERQKKYSKGKKIEEGCGPHGTDVQVNILLLLFF